MPRIDTDIVTRPHVVRTNPIRYATTILGAKVRKPTGSPHAEKLVGGLQQRRVTCGKPHFCNPVTESTPGYDHSRKNTG